MGTACIFLNLKKIERQKAFIVNFYCCPFDAQTRMWRTIDAHLRAVRLAIPFSSSSSAPLNYVRRTVLSQHHFHALSPKSHSLSHPKTLVPRANTASASSVLGLRSQSFGSGIGLLIVRCISSVSPAHTLEWNEPVSGSEVGDGNNGTVQEETKPSIPVRAYFFSTRFVSIWVFACFPN